MTEKVDAMLEKIDRLETEVSMAKRLIERMRSAICKSLALQQQALTMTGWDQYEMRPAEGYESHTYIDFDQLSAVLGQNFMLSTEDVQRDPVEAAVQEPDLIRQSEEK